MEKNLIDKYKVIHWISKTNKYSSSLMAAATIKERC